MKLLTSLVYRGDAENAARFIAAQEAVLEELHAPAEDGEEPAEAGQETGEGSASPKDGQTMEDVIQQAEEALSGSGGSEH